MKTLSTAFSINIAAQQLFNPTLAALAPNTALDLGAWAGTAVGGSDQSSSWSDYSKMVYDARRRQMVCFGGGHASTHYNAIMCVKLDTLQQVEEYPPTKCFDLAYPATGKYDALLGAWLAGSWTDSGPYPRPIARHTEDGMVVVGDELHVIQHVEGNPNTCGWDVDQYALSGPGRVPVYNFITKTWTFTDAQCLGNNWPGFGYNPTVLPGHPSGLMVGLTGSGGTQGTGLYAYDPASHSLGLTLDINTTGGSQRVRDESGNVIETDPFVLFNYNNSAVYVPDLDKFYYFERSTGVMWRIDYDYVTPTNSLIVRLNATGTPCPMPPVSSGEVGLAWDSKNKLIGVGPVNNVFYTFNPATKAWANQTIQGGTPGSVGFHALGYCPVNNVFVFFTDAKRFWCYRWN